MWTIVQFAISYLVSFDYNKAEERSPTDGMAVSNHHWPSLLYSASANINQPKVFIATNITVNRVVRRLEGKGDEYRKILQNVGHSTA